MDSATKKQIPQPSGPPVPLFRSLRWRLLVIGLAIWALATGVFGIGAILLQQATLRNQALRTVSAVAAARADQVQTVTRQVTRQIEAVAGSPEAQAILKGPRSPEQAAWLQKRIVYPALPIAALTFLDRDGMAVLTTGASGSGAEVPVVRPADTAGTQVQTLPFADGEPHALRITVPVRSGPATEPLGWLQARVITNRLQELLFDQADIGPSGSTVLVGPEGRLLTASAPGSGDLGRRVDNWAIRRAYETGRAVSGIYRDDRGVSVVGAVAQMPGLNWILLTEVDETEILAPVRQLALATLMLWAIGALVGGLTSLNLSSRLVQPLQVLSAAASDLAAGQWDGRVPVQGQDELGALSLAFNRMTDAVSAAMAREQAEKAFNANLLASVPLGLLVLSADLRVVSVNLSFREMFGQDEVLSGRPLRAILPAQPLLDQAARVLASGEPVRNMVVEVPPDRLLRATIVGIRLEGEAKAARLLLVLEDLTEEERLRTAAHASELKFAGILAVAPDAIISFNETQRIVLFNQGAEATFGYTATEVLGRRLDMLLPDYFAAAVATEERCEMVGQRKDGDKFPAEAWISRLQVAGEHLVTVVLRDITERKRAEEALRESEERFRSAFDNAAVGMALVGMDGQLLQVNGSLCEMLGYSEEELLAKPFLSLAHSDDLSAHLQCRRQLLKGRIRSYQMEKRYLHKSGQVVWAWLSVSLVRDGQDRPLYLISQLQDMTERKRMEAELVHAANYDPLTNLFNRRRFQTELEILLSGAREGHGHGALLFLDLDHFKYVNDSLDHLAGDEVLKGLAEPMRVPLQEGDTLARLGGDEFGVLLPGADAVRAQAAAEQILEAIRRHVTLTGSQPVGITASAGIVLYPEHGTTPEALLARVDLAMYQAKEEGRDGFCLYTPDRDRQAELESKLTWEKRIRHALDKDLFVLHCQPILDLHANRVTRHELLLRMIGDNGETIAPGAFLGVAERFGLIHAIDRWVVRQAIHLIAGYEQAGVEMCLEVNLSGRAFADAKLLPMIQHELAVTGINPASLVLEITETAAIADAGQARKFIDTLKQLGCRFAIDDFGVGFASFNYLKHLPVDYLKIDGSFIQNLSSDPGDQHLVKAMVEVARGLGKLTIAEFVENEETVALLRTYGVDYAQGYHISRPMAISQLVPSQAGGRSPLVS